MSFAFFSPRAAAATTGIYDLNQEKVLHESGKVSEKVR
jgi:hypothetical protein